MVNWLNAYFQAVIPIIKHNQGLVLEILGDGLLAVFGTPISRGIEQDALNAVRAAVEMVDEVARLNEQFQAEGKPEVKIGVGINTGIASAALIGTEDRIKYTVIGDTVNLASRLQDKTKEFGQPILVSAATAHLIQEEFPPLFCAETIVKGMAQPVELYTVAM
jgi:class 3 adenylate cyclase